MGEGRQEPREGTRSPRRPPGNPSPAQLDSKKILGTKPSSRKRLCICFLGTFIRKLRRDGMGREAGGVFRMGDTRAPMADSCQCMGKNTTIL